MTIEKQAVHFHTRAIKISAWMMKKQGLRSPAPAIVMGPGLSGVKDCIYDLIAGVLAAADYVVVLFDYPGFGESEGLPQQEINPELQIETYRAAFDFLSSQQGVDTNRIGLWGGSYSGSHALVAASLENRVRCVVAMTPFVSGSAHWQSLSDKMRIRLSALFEKEEEQLQASEQPSLIPVVSNDPHVFCMLPGPSAYQFGMFCKQQSEYWRNEVTLNSLAMHFRYDPIRWVPDIQAPVLMQIAEEDELIPASESKRLYQALHVVKEFRTIPGNHFSPYQTCRDLAMTQAINWFDRHLK